MRDYSRASERFHSRYQKLDTGCWWWTAKICRRGYGRLHVKGRNRPAHRFALEQRLGRGLKPGMIACHTCDNRWCVNPEHIYEGTHATNTADRWRAGTAYHAEGTKNGHAKVTEEEVKMIRFLQENGVGYNVLGKMFGLSKPALSAIKHRKNWTHI